MAVPPWPDAMRQLHACPTQVPPPRPERRSRARAWLGGLVLCVVSLLASAAPAPDLLPHQLVWRQWTVTEGLPQITVNDILQDRAGYLWVATQHGIARFDGVAFHAYTPDENPGLGHGVISALSLDRDGALWMGSAVGVSRFVGGRIVAVRAEGKGTGTVIGLAPHPDGGVWVACENGLFHASGRTAKRVPLREPRIPMFTVLRPADGPELAIGHFHIVVDPAGRRRVVPLHTHLPPVISAALADDGGLWLGTIDGLYRTDREGRARGEPILKGREITSVRPVADGSMWISTDRGLMQRRRDGAIQPTVVPGITTTTWVGRVYEDRERNLWVGTQLTGLHRAWPDRFRRYTTRDGLVDGTVWSVYEAPDGEMWAGTTEGLYRGGLGGFHREIEGDGLPHPTVEATLVDRRGGLWIGTYAGLVYRPAGSTRPVPVPKAGKTGVYALFEDRDGSILIGTLDGLYRARDGRPQSIEFVKLPGQADGIGVSGIVRGRDGPLWVGYESGVAYRDGDRWVLAPAPATGPIRAATLTAFGDGVLAAGIDGLFHVNARRSRRIGRAEGLHHDAVHSTIVSDRDVWYQGPRGAGRIPIPMFEALLRGERTRVDVDVFGDLGAPQMAQCNGGQQNSIALTQGRWLWCPSLQGALALDLATIDRRGAPPHARLQTLSTPRRRLDLALQPGGLELEPGERDLQIGFTGLYLRAAERLRFHGRLVGYDTKWQALDRRRTVYYTNLPPGRYTFELFARNEDGVPGPKVALRFEIRPFWYETALARAGAAIALLLLVAGGVRWRLHALHRQRQVLEARVRKRTGQLEAANQALEALNRRLEAASVTDPLTGLHNRRYLLQHLPHELARLDRLHSPGHESDAVLTFLHLDLDHFKRINDTHGHHVGDQVLQGAAALLRANSRASDFVLRWGGEELLVIGRDTGRDDAHAWASRIVESFRRHVFDTDAGPLRVTCSVGHAVYPMRPGHRDGLGWEDVMNLADGATYLAKHEGRDRCIGFELLRTAAPADFIARVHADPYALEAEGWIRIRREARRAGADPATPARA